MVETLPKVRRVLWKLSLALMLFTAKIIQDGSLAATLSQINDAHGHYKGFGRTGEFTLARREGDFIVFLLNHRHYDLNNLKPVAFDSDLAEPMRRALSGKSGTVTGLDYRGETVLAAHEPVAVLNLGIVAKIDLAEIREPFFRAGVIAGCLAIIVVLTGAFLFLRISNPIMRNLEERSANLRRTNEKLQKEIEERNLAEKALRESEERLSRILESAMDAIITIDNTRSVVFFNEAAEKTFRCPAADVIGEPIDRFLSKKVSVLLSNEQHASSKPNNTDYNFWIPEGLTAIRADGEEFPIEGTISEVEVAGQKLHTIILHDIDERKKAEEKLQKLQIEKNYLQEEIKSEHNFGEIIGASKVMKKVFQNIEKVAATDSTVY